MAEVDQGLLPDDAKGPEGVAQNQEREARCREDREAEPLLEAARGRMGGYEG